MFIEIALRDLAPSTLILLRMGSGALALAVYITADRPPPSARCCPYAWPLALLGLVNTAVPFFLIAWGQQYIDSGLAAIFNASAPLFTALFAIALRPEPARDRHAARRRRARVRRRRAARRLRALAAASEPSRAALAVVAASACYGLGGLYAGRRFAGLPPSLVAFGTLVWATLFVLPFGAAQASSLGWEALVSVLYLGVAAHRRRVPPLLRADRRRRRLEGRARHLPRAVARARLRRGLPRRDRDGALARRPRARARGRRARARVACEGEPLRARCCSSSPPSGAPRTSSSRSRWTTSRPRR